MRSSSIISLFGETLPPRRGPSAFVTSILVHACACVLLFLGLNQPHKVDISKTPRRYSVRMMELHQPQPKIHEYVPHESAELGHTGAVRSTLGNSSPTAPAPRIPTNFMAQKQVVQTLVQPDVANNNLILKETPLPQVMMWSSRELTVKTIAPVSQQTEAKIEVQPSLEPPNQALHVSDLRISPGPSETKAPLPEPSKTSPVTSQGPQPAQKIPETASKNSGQPSPASVISLSDVQMKDGTATLPMINQVAPAPFSGSLSPGQPKSTSETGSSTTISKQNGASAGQTPGQSEKAAKAGTGVGSSNGTTGALVGPEALDSGGGLRSTTHLSLPRDGQFGMVVVGSSAADEYPEAASTWSGRLAYTVYLHVGTHKNWILQYSIPRSQEVAKAGASARPEAPWPYDVTRPSIDPDTGAEAIIIHGFVNATGHFERLAIVFPAELAEAKFLLHALQQWEFRPATQNGVITQVEVLLIIPDETD
jgi:hypothetical protein